jgi:altronate dehydratase
VHKKDPRTRLDAVIEYAEPLGVPGFTFMNGPGNDLEGIAGQVASGCNLIVFVTGNGSITNFPFVPTLKITTTTRRHELLAREMDINAGRYLDGESMAQLTTENFDLLVDTASGRRTKGEHAGHSQVSLWRNWRQTDGSKLESLRARPAPDGRPLRTSSHPGDGAAPARTERIGLILPTSLCAGQIARLAAERLNANRADSGVDRFVALAHTEGCGFGGGSMHELLHRTYRGYLTHPNVVAALLLEHGCEKVPNDLMRAELTASGIAPERFGWASVQLDGGIDRVLGRIDAWFAEKLGSRTHPERERADGPRRLRVGMMSAVAPGPNAADVFALIARDVIEAGGSVLVPESDALLASEEFRSRLLDGVVARATLAYGEPVRSEGFHVVATESEHWVENLTALGGCGAHLVVGLVAPDGEPGHVLVPVVQVSENAGNARHVADEIDLVMSGNPSVDAARLRAWIEDVARGEKMPAALRNGLVDFQLSRGNLGVTT